MGGFHKIPSGLKILMIELVAVFFFPITIAGIANQVSHGLFPDRYELQGTEDWIMAFVGPLFVTWVLYDIFRPRVKDQIWGIFFRVKFRFCSTHPSYVLIDLITIIFTVLFLVVGRAGEFDTGGWWLIPATAVCIPVVRLFAWYVFGFRIQDTETYDAYQPALWVFCIFALIFGGGSAVVFLT